MTNIVVAIHVIACVVLIAIILVQRGRGGGFIESFAGLESMFGTKTSSFLSKLTSVMAVIFFCTCLTLAFLSLKESKSLMRSVKPKTTAPQTANATANQTGQDSPQAQAAPVNATAGQTQPVNPAANKTAN